MAQAFHRQGTGNIANVPSRSRIQGLLLAESGGAASVITIDDSTDGTGSKLAVIALDANGHIFLDLSQITGIGYDTGIYATVSAGTVDITVFI